MISILNKRFEIWRELFIIALFLRKEQKQRNNEFSRLVRKVGSSLELLFTIWIGVFE